MTRTPFMPPRPGLIFPPDCCGRIRDVTLGLAAAVRDFDALHLARRIELEPVEAFRIQLWRANDNHRREEVWR